MWIEGGAVFTPYIPNNYDIINTNLESFSPSKYTKLYENEQNERGIIQWRLFLHAYLNYCRHCKVVDSPMGIQTPD